MLAGRGKLIRHRVPLIVSATFRQIARTRALVGVRRGTYAVSLMETRGFLLSQKVS